MSTRQSIVLLRAAFAVAILSLFAGAAPAAAQITVNVVHPPADIVEDDPLPLAVTVTSVSDVTSVTAAVGTHTIALTFSAPTTTWFGHLPLDGLPRGPQQLVVTAMNAVSQQAQVTRPFFLDRRPVITITAPTEYALALPDIRVAATCVDDGGPCQLTVGTDHVPLAAGTGSIDTRIAPNDGVKQLEFIATDSTGRTTKVLRIVVVHSSTKVRAEAGFTGAILDIQPDRALIYDDTATPKVVRIVDRATNASQIIWTAGAPNSWINRGVLTPGGGVLLSAFNPPLYPDHLWEWRGGTLNDLGVGDYVSLKVNGQWAIYSDFAPNNPKKLFLRDLIAGTTITVDPDAGHFNNDVTADGRVFYWKPEPVSQIFRFEPGPPPTTTQLTNSAPAQSIYPVTDGVNVVFTRRVVGSPLPSIVLRTGGGTEVVLATDVFGGGNDQNYRIAAGWVAFPRRSGAATLQVWLRAPDGTERQLSSDAGTVTIEALNANGEVAFTTSTSTQAHQVPRQRYLARADGSILHLGTAIGTPYFIDGEWYIAAGGQLLAVEPETPSRSILSEGATGTFFTTDVAILNPHKSAVPVTIRYLRENAPEIQETRTLPALSRTTIHEDDIPGLEGTSVSTVVDAPGTAPVVVERLMTWDATGYGGHLGTAVERPRQRWLFAEGAQGFFQTFFLLANSGASDATVRFTFLVEQGSPVTETVTVTPGARKTLYAGDVAGLINRSFATVIESDVPIVAERAMYFGQSPFWLGGHGSTGVPAPAYRWFHAEGATGSLFDTFILLANPHPVDVTVNVIYSTDTGVTIQRPRTLPALSRLTINVEEEAPELASTAVSTRIEPAFYPIVSERAMYWGTTGAGWREAHNSFGVTEAGLKWGLAEGRSGGARAYQTYVLIANPSQFGAELRATFIKEDGTTVTRTYSVAAFQRFNIDTRGISELNDSNFSTIVESTNGVPFNVESAIYWNVNGVIWEGGGNTVATPLP